MEIIKNLETTEVPLEILQHDACGAVDRNLTGTAVLVLRGQCPFSTKTQHISKAGAKVVIVYNNLHLTTAKSAEV